MKIKIVIPRTPSAANVGRITQTVLSTIPARHMNANAREDLTDSFATNLVILNASMAVLVIT